MRNMLFYGDNLRVLREHIADESVPYTGVLTPRLLAASARPPAAPWTIRRSGASPAGWR